MISDNSISRSTAIQLALQLMIEFIVILRPTQACLSGGGCCPPTPQRIQKSPPQPQCQSAPSCSGDFSSYAPQTPFGIGASGSYYQPPITYVSSGGAPPSYGVNARAKSGNFYSGVGKGADRDSFYSGGGKRIDTGYGGGEEIVNLTPPPINIPLPPQQPLEEESGYDQKLSQAEIKLTPLATEVPPSNAYSEFELQNQSESVDDAYAKIVTDHEVEQQQKQLYTEIGTAEKSHAKSDIIDYGGGAAPRISETQLPQVKFEQPEPEAIYGGGAAPSNIEMQSLQMKFEKPGAEAVYGGGAAPDIGETQLPQVKFEQPAPETAYGGGSAPSISETQSSQVKLEKPAPETAYGGGSAPSISETQSSQVKLEKPEPEAVYGGGAAPSISETQSSQVKFEQPESAYGVEVVTSKSNVPYQGITSSPKSEIGSATSESLKAEIQYGGQEGNTIVESRSVETDDSMCNDPVLKAIIESTLNEYRDNLDAARNIESKAAKRFGGRFNSIVSDSEFAYVNWYGKRNCQLQINGRHSLTWED